MSIRCIPNYSVCRNRCIEQASKVSTFKSVYHTCLTAFSAFVAPYGSYRLGLPSPLRLLLRNHDEELNNSCSYTGGLGIKAKFGMSTFGTTEVCEILPWNLRICAKFCHSVLLVVRP